MNAGGAGDAGGAAEAGWTRVLGRLGGGEAGPTLIIVGGIHGNEPAGAHAFLRVVDRLRAARVPLRGALVGLAGNLGALRRDQRFIDRDLNRLWSDAALAALDAAPTPRDAEAREHAELRVAIEATIAAARGPVTFLDLHTTSAEGIPFALCGDWELQRAFAAHFPLPLVLGMQERVEGALVRHMADRGFASMAVEGGQHRSASALANLEASCWIALAATGLLAPGTLADAIEAARAHLDEARDGLPHVMQIDSRHAVTPLDEFRMEPGFANIDRVTAGQLLARDRSGELRATADGLVLLPLYQAHGQDGFFLGHAVAG